ncbi:hypothetical protein LCGC14_2780780 [marine sediment metagenome]|uniref:PD-(D/E)XK endonuclease-like domain-containing protein n=1 Tax=marine sediment metagenome TaxID=412755 RepID=A0A0F9BJW1_9ZZZZ
MRSAEFRPPKHDSSIRLGVRDAKDAHPHADSKFGCNQPRSLDEFFKDVRIAPIRSSAIHDFEHCPRKFLYRYKLGITPRGYQPALHIGTVFHLVLQAMFMGKSQEESLDAAKQYFHRFCNKLLASADEVGFTPGGKSVEGVIKSANDDYHKARAMAISFMSFKPFDWSKWELLYTPDGTPCVELLLEAKVKGIPVPIIAPCDLALLRKGTKDVFIVDHKTTSADTLARARSIKISSQIALYRLVLQCHLDVWAEEDNKYVGLRVRGSIHNIVKKPTIKYCKKDPTFEDYINRVTAWYKEKHEEDPEHSPILQPETMFTEPTLTKELFMRLRQQARAARAAPSLDRFYRAGDYACHQFNSVCAYADLCDSNPVMWPDIVRTRFDIEFREDSEEERND